MSKYVDAEELKKVIRANDWSNPAVPNAVAVIINYMPAADVESVRHGHWSKTCVPDVYQCSYCKKPVKMDELCDSELLREYCPKCGAKMDGEVGKL